MFKGVLVDKGDGGLVAEVRDLNESDLPDGDVTVAIHYSGINYKDALAVTGAGKIIRSFPMVPGIDLVGVVESSDNARFEPGDKVILNGWGIGESHWGGLAQKARVKSEWLVPLPDQLSLEEAIAIGTAGYTAMLSVLALERQGVTPESGDIAVTGANGGVGSVAIAVLSKLGYSVTAVTGRPEEWEYLQDLGAAEVVDRNDFAGAGKPLQRERWAGAIDAAGGHTLANIVATTKYRGVVTACGLADSMDFPGNMAPFILRGVTLVGIDSVMCPREDRLEAWKRLARDLDLEKLGTIAKTISLNDVLSASADLLNGKIQGRVVVDVNDV